MSAISLDPQRLLFAAAAVVIYAFMCLAIARGQFARQRSTGESSANHGAQHWRVVYASQTGTAQQLAQQTADTLHLAGIAVKLSVLDELDVDDLSNAERILFVISTYGEGNSPDNAVLFVKHVMGAQRMMHTALPLKRLHYALLALGDHSYSHFCGFGRELEHWLQTQGAQALFPAITVDCGNPAAIESWRHQLSHLAGTDDAPDWQGPVYEQWRLVARNHLNPGSQGGEIFHLEFELPAGAGIPVWESGDLAQILVPTDAGHPREYSIASIPSDGRLHLLVRLHRHPDGSPGNASGWLTGDMQIGHSVQLRLRRHERFRLGTNDARPLILIGNGSGIAGLRGHLKARAARGAQSNWLVFGERSSNCDYHYRAEIEMWHRTGMLEQLDVVFSRDQPERRYVQDRLLEVKDVLSEWISRGAAIYVCGSLHGMAGGVDDALAQALGRTVLEELSLEGRYRRDVY